MIIAVNYLNLLFIKYLIRNLLLAIYFIKQINLYNIRDFLNKLNIKKVYFMALWMQFLMLLKMF